MHRVLIRPVAVIVFCAALVTSSVVLHAHAISQFCGYWEGYLFEPNDLWCFDDGGFYTWTWSGGYDIAAVEPEEQRLWLATDICDDLVFSCWDACESDDFKTLRAQYYTDQTWGQCTYSAGCVESWGTPSCQQGSTGTFSCSCGSINLCMPCG